LNPQVRDYLSRIREHLYLEPAAELQVMRELRTYFEERIAEYRESGYSEDEAVRLAVKSFGRPKVIARLMHEAHSQRTWGEALLAALPHFVVAIVFGLGLWYHLWIPVILAPIAAVTIWGWWQGKPFWLYPWVGYSLLPLLVAGYFLVPIINKTVLELLLGGASIADAMILFGILVFYSVSVVIIAATAVRVVKRDWILTSLMLFPLPVVGGWMIMRDKAIGLMSGSSEALHALDLRMTWALVTLGLSTIIFLRLRHRSHKLGALVVAGLLAFTLVWHMTGQPVSLPALVLTALLLGFFFLAPALAEPIVGHGEDEPVEDRRLRWHNS
jgi:plasmid stabilization system protein ParE